MLNKFNITEKKKREKFKTQLSIYDWIIGLGIKAENNDRTTLSPKELDIFIPEKNLAIEYNGLMYHSFGKNSWSAINNYQEESERKNNHLQKTEECQEKGIQLLHIFENEWDEKEDLWKSAIQAKLGLNEKIFARKCEVKEISFKESLEFLEINHLQGSSISSIQLGLFFYDRLVSVMTFGKSRYNKKYQYELLRFCSLQGLTITGGASKLFSYFKKKYQPDSVISYANRRWSNGNLYRQMGFSEIGSTLPNYFYFNDVLQLHSRLKFQKHKLPEILAVYNEEWTETQNMYENGYRKIYDCGNYVFEWKK